MTSSVRSLFASRRSKLLAAVASASAIALFALLLPASATAAQGGTGSLTDGGVLALHLGAQDRLGFRPPSAVGYPSFTKQQSIGNGQGCKIALGADVNASEQLITFSPPSANNSNPYTGFVSDAIGVGSKNEGNGQPCGRIDSPPGQTMTMDLGSALAGKVIDYAEIDVELKFSATLTITGYLNGTQVGMPQTYSSNGSDSGPDSADGDNYRIRFPKLLPECGACTTTVNRLVFGIQTTGGASLEGGADGTGPCDASDGCVEPSLGQTIGDDPSTEVIETTSDSLFHLVDVDGILDCPSGTGDSSASEQDPGVLSSTLDRQENAIDPETGVPQPCVPIPYNLESGDGAAPGCTPGSLQCILLQKDLLGQATQFYWTVTWNPESADYPETPTLFDFDLDGTFQSLQPCLEDSDGDGLPQLPPTVQGDDGNAVDPWCITDTSTDFDPATGLQTVTETYFGGGDPGGKR